MTKVGVSAALVALLGGAMLAFSPAPVSATAVAGFTVAVAGVGRPCGAGRLGGAGKPEDRTGDASAQHPGQARPEHGGSGALYVLLRSP